MDDQIFIQHRFTIERDGASFSDAIVMLQSEYDQLSNQDIEDLKNDRFDKWQETITNPPVDP